MIHGYFRRRSYSRHCYWATTQTKQFFESAIRWLHYWVTGDIMRQQDNELFYKWCPKEPCDKTKMLANSHAFK